MTRQHGKTNPYVYMETEKANQIVQALYSKSVHQYPDLLKAQRPNIILILWESFTAKTVKSLGGMEGVTPEFEKLISEGVLFSNFYASSDRSDRGITAVLSGYPAQPTRSIIKTPAKACKLPTLASSLDKAGYSTSFYYGGELDFANIRSYLVNSGFDKMVGKDDFEEKDCNSKWGAHDHVVFDKFLLDTDEKYAKDSI